MDFKIYRTELGRDPEYVAVESELRPLLELADDVLALRLERGWSQTELARRVGTHQANISRLENGLANPTLAFIQKVAAALNTEATVRLHRHDDLPGVETLPETSSSSGALRHLGGQVASTDELDETRHELWSAWDRAKVT
jgi:transcriptional regulator with XRE-family HTH domain